MLSSDHGIVGHQTVWAWLYRIVGIAKGSTLQGFKSAVGAALRLFAAQGGYRMVSAGTAPLTYAPFLKLCTAAGLRPKTVFDVGVGHGTPWLYEAFPDSHVVLVEPLSAFAPALKELCCRLKASLHPVAVGSSEGELEIRVPEIPTGASLKDRSSTWKAKVGDRQTDRFETIHVTTLDKVSEGYEPPFVLKLDIEGYELEALKGALRMLADTDLIITEASVVPRHQNDSLLQDIVTFLTQHQFDLIEIVEISQLRDGGPSAFVDVAFAKRNGVFQTAYWGG